MTADGSGVMFDGIAKRYDLCNRLLSMGLDRSWRRRLVDAIGEIGEGAVLDVATGTADVAIAIARRHPEAHVVGIDPSEGMLSVARRKITGLSIELVSGCAESLPFPSDAFAASTMAFGIRNVPDRLAALREMARVTVPGGVVAVLELGEPRWSLARAHVHRTVPRIGAWLSGSEAYDYLRASIAAFPEPDEFTALMERAGLDFRQHASLTFGAANLFVATA